MKVGWKKKSLEDVCQFSNGLWKGEKPPYVNVGVIRNTNFTKDGMLDDSDIAFLDVEERKYEKRRLKFGDIILEKSGGGPKQPVGRVALFDKNDGDYSFSNFTSALRVLEPQELDFRFLHKFLYWIYLSGVTEGMQSHSTGIRNLDGNAYKAIKISFPPLPEQQRIVKILDKAFEGIATAKANTEKNLFNARALFESYLNNVFTKRGEGWEEKRLSECVEDVSTGPFGSMLHKSDYKHGGIPLVNPINIKGNRIVPDYQKAVGTSTAQRLRKYKLQMNDIVVARRGEIGRCAVVVHDQVGWLCGTGCFVIRSSDKVNPYILTHLLRSSLYREKLERVAARATMANISNTDLANLRIWLPPISVQHQILKYLENLSIESNDLESVYQRKLDSLEDLKKSLLHHAFQGEL